ncbi:MAG: ATP-binding cassette domain-containing protein [Candidatus Moranbacteria bacterium]|nr:ATP-binding cassette domain-containing protein [Candidatus Moranbacteria bacterium]
MLKASGIIKKYENRIVLDDVSVEVEQGKITSIIGPSGSGKTTLLKALSMLELPQSGSIVLDDKTYNFPEDDSNITPPWPKISVVFQQLFIWPHLTIRENIELPLKLKGLLQENKAYLEELYKMFHMKEFIDRYPNEVSLGQRQRGALVRALALKPDYLLLDEITSSLDVEQAEIILSHLVKIKEKGVGIIMVAHDIDFALSSADNVCFLDGGKIIKQGKPYEFLLETENKRISSFIRSASLGTLDVKIYSGQEEFQAYHMAFINRIPEKSVVTVIGGVGDTWFSSMGDKYKEFDDTRKRKNIKYRMLMYEIGSKEKRLVRERPDINEYYILPSHVKNLANINIHDDGAVVLQIFDTVPTVIEINNQALATSYMNYYNDLVKQSEKLLG